MFLLSAVSRRTCCSHAHVLIRTTQHQIPRYFSSINQEEVNKFAKIGSAWWDPRSSSGTGPLHYMNPIRVRFIREQISKFHHSSADLPEARQLEGMTALDIGCGGGILAEALARLGAKVTAVDPSPENIAVARRHSITDSLTRHIDYRVGTIQDVVKRGETYDIVCALEVIEHVASPLEFLRDCSLCVNPSSDISSSGHLFISTLNRTAKSYALAIVGAEYITNMVPQGTHEWQKFLTPQELKDMLQKIKFTSIKENGIVLDELPIFTASKLIQKRHDLRWGLSDNDLDVNYILHARSQ